MEWSPSEILWFEVCRGERCCICEDRFPPPHEREMTYCLRCAPEDMDIPHAVAIHIDHHDEGFSAHIVSEEPPRFVLWMVGLNRNQIDALLQRGRIPQHRRDEAFKDFLQWGRTSVTTHIAEDEYQRLRKAAQRDPRVGDEKARDLSGDKR